ncbi:hypothetical protein CEE69_28960 [Rhodopirellula bahusiensis]|uniref:Uncharacterized protein n=1 Tax=Rhodopirellula bahusiensis TaxID=2014065 RepID=A0A2G1VZH3_9BACT|nr:hypothetical protein CEE69_28960 [Rhodopirellula bahusiensis]
MRDDGEHIVAVARFDFTTYWAVGCLDPTVGPIVLLSDRSNGNQQDALVPSNLDLSLGTRSWPESVDRRQGNNRVVTHLIAGPPARRFRDRRDFGDKPLQRPGWKFD